MKKIQIWKDVTAAAVAAGDSLWKIHYFREKPPATLVGQHSSSAM